MKFSISLLVLLFGIFLVIASIIYFILTFTICLGAGFILGFLCISAGLREYKKINEKPEDTYDDIDYE